MRLIALGIAITITIGALLLETAHTDPAPQKQVLPRSFGPLTLGMSKEAFNKVTGLTPSPCPHCALNESSAAVYVEKYPGLFPAYVSSLKEYQRGFGCDFFKGKLYRIEAFPEIEQIESAKKKYTQIYGQPSKTIDWPNGLSMVVWENNKTALVLTYVRVQRKDYTYPLTMPAGTVSSVEYIDIPLRDALDAQEKKKPTRHHH